MKKNIAKQKYRPLKIDMPTITFTYLKVVVNDNSIMYVVITNTPKVQCVE